jgi:hypothetical protein
MLDRPNSDEVMTREVSAGSGSGVGFFGRRSAGAHQQAEAAKN